MIYIYTMDENACVNAYTKNWWTRNNTRRVWPNAMSLREWMFLDQNNGVRCFILPSFLPLSCISCILLFFNHTTPQPCLPIYILLSLIVFSFSHKKNCNLLLILYWGSWVVMLMMNKRIIEGVKNKEESLNIYISIFLLWE